MLSKKGSLMKKMLAYALKSWRLSMRKDSKLSKALNVIKLVYLVLSIKRFAQDLSRLVIKSLQ